MSELRSVIRQGVERLESQGFKVEVEGYEGVSEQEFDAFQTEHGVQLPEDLRQILSDLDGFSVIWESADDRGIFLFPSIAELHTFRRSWIETEVPYRRNTLLENADPTSLAIADQIWHWVPFEDHFNGDFTCVDCRDGRVYFTSHEQLELVTPIADNVTSYLVARAKDGFAHWEFF